MKIINEELLIDQSKVSEINKKNGDDWTNAVIDALKALYTTDYSKYINTTNKDFNKLTDLILAIKKYGWDTNTNHYLELMNALIENNKPLNREAFLLGSQLLLEDNDVRLVGNNWFLELNSYEPLYKAKALAFLNSKKAMRFGDEPKKAAEDVKGMSTQQEIENYLSNWLTKSGEGYDSGESILSRIMKNPKSFFTAADLTYVKPILAGITKQGDLLTDVAKSMIKILLEATDDKKQYSSVIKELTNPKANEYWKKWYDKFVRFLDSNAGDDIADTKRYILIQLDDIKDDAELRGHLGTPVTSTKSSSTTLAAITPSRGKGFKTTT